MKHLALGLALLTVISCFGTARAAVALPPATYNLCLNIFEGDCRTTSGVIAETDIDGSIDKYHHNEALGLGTPVVSVASIWHDDGYVLSWAGNSATLQYSYAVEGPADEIVPITVHYAMGYTSSPLGSLQPPGVGSGPGFAAYTQATIDTDGAPVTQNVQGGVPCIYSTVYYIPLCAAGDAANNVTSKLFEGTATYLIHTNTAYGVSLFAETTNPDYGNVAAYADPQFFIDPDFSATHPGYSLVFSDGIGNALANVPEPGSWILMLVGVGLLGARLRTRINTRSPADPQRHASTYA